MWTMEHSVRLQNDEIPGEVVDFTVIDHMDEWSGLDHWEQKVRDVGFQAMRKMVASSLVEKAGDLVVAKRQKKRQRMHWSHHGAEAVSALRTLWLNGEWDQHWKPSQRTA